MRDAGHVVASISPFAARHAAWWYLAGLTEWRDTGKGGNERADEVFPVAAAWLKEHAHEASWVLHVNFWDPHTPYRTPASARGTFRDQPPPSWIDEETLRRQWEGYGTLSARDPMGYWFPSALRLQHEDVPPALASLDDVRAWIDAYDEGIAYADAYVGRLLDLLETLGVLDDTTVVVTADHGENQGELGVYGDHQTADVITTRVPFVWKGPGSLPAPWTRDSITSSTSRQRSSSGPEQRSPRPGMRRAWLLPCARAAAAVVRCSSRAKWRGAASVRCASDGGRTFGRTTTASRTCPKIFCSTWSPTHT